MLQNIEGQTIPAVTFKTRDNDQWFDVSSQQLFANKTVVLFSLPGAFTPTCSSTHLPRYNELAHVFAQNGVDEVICMSVNDTFVMNAWLKDQAVENITVIPDGNGEFTQGMGMLVDKQAIGFGKRSWRYSMLVKNGVIEKMFIEPEKDGDPFEVSDADTMLNYINSDAKAPQDVSMFTKPDCPHCASAKQLLTDKNIPFEEIVLGQDATLVSLRAVSGRDTVPQIFMAGTHIGGADDLRAYFS